jgi:CheY-like chemotaxis protein
MLKTIRIPTNSKVFILEDMEERILWFRQKLKGAKDVGLCKTATGAIALLQIARFDIVFLDHDLGFLDAADITRPDGNGKEVARYLRESKFPGMVVLHSLNQPARNIMSGILPQAHIAPFGTFDIILI